MANGPAYDKGYAAGRRRTVTDDRDAFRRAVFLAALPEIIRTPWGCEVDDEWKTYNTVSAIADTAWNVADAAVAKRFK